MEKIFMINQLMIKSNIMIKLKNYNRTWRWLHNRMFIRLSILQKSLSINYSWQDKLDTDPRLFKKTESYGMLKTSSHVSKILEKTTVLEFYKWTAKGL